MTISNVGEWWRGKAADQRDREADEATRVWSNQQILTRKLGGALERAWMLDL